MRNNDGKCKIAEDAIVLFITVVEIHDTNLYCNDDNVCISILQNKYLLLVKKKIIFMCVSLSIHGVVFELNASEPFVYIPVF